MPRALQIGSLSPRSGDKAKAWVEPKREFEMPDVVHNAMMPPGSLKVAGVLWNSAPRPGSLVAFTLPSKGISC